MENKASTQKSDSTLSRIKYSVRRIFTYTFRVPLLLVLAAVITYLVTLFETEKIKDALLNSALADNTEVLRWIYWTEFTTGVGQLILLIICILFCALVIYQVFLAKRFYATLVHVRKLSEPNGAASERKPFEGYKSIQSELSALRDAITTSEKIKKQNKELNKRQYKDPLTSLLNKAALQLLEKNKSALPAGSGVIVFDVDDFKSFNDEHGHSYGDYVLQVVAKTLKNNLSRDDKIYRFGGDEMVAYLEGISEEAVKSIRARLDKAMFKIDVKTGHGHEDGKIYLSSGYAISDGTQNFKKLFEAADIMLYKSKENKKSRKASAINTVKL